MAAVRKWPPAAARWYALRPDGASEKGVGGRTCGYNGIHNSSVAPGGSFVQRRAAGGIERQTAGERVLWVLALKAIHNHLDRKTVVRRRREVERRVAIPVCFAQCFC